MKLLEKQIKRYVWHQAYHDVRELRWNRVGKQVMWNIDNQVESIVWYQVWYPISIEMWK